MSIIKLPGLIDPHVHLREPGATHKEDFKTGTEAALAGGIVAVCDMPNNPEPTITHEALEKKIHLADEKAVCDVYFFFGASPKDNTSEFSQVWDHPRVVGLKIYMDTTTGTLLVEEKSLLEKIFEKWESDKPIVVHAEGETMTKALSFAKAYNRQIHIAHLSQKSELIEVIKAKETGIKVTCEVTPHHLFLTREDEKRLGPYGIMKPPLRTREDAEFIWSHIDMVDCIATDHAPHTKEEKASGKAPYGVPGLETSLPLMLTSVHEGKIELKDIVRLMHHSPKQIFINRVVPISNRLETAYVEVDIDTEYTINSNALKTKCGWTPFEGVNVRGKVLRVHNGK
jgi:dihydroorotase